MAAGGHAHFTRWLVREGVGGRQQCRPWDYRRDRRRGVTGGLRYKAGMASGIVAVFELGVTEGHCDCAGVPDGEFGEVSTAGGPDLCPGYGGGAGGDVGGAAGGFHKGGGIHGLGYKKSSGLAVC